MSLPQLMQPQAVQRPWAESAVDETKRIFRISC